MISKGTYVRASIVQSIASVVTYMWLYMTQVWASMYQLGLAALAYMLEQLQMVRVNPRTALVLILVMTATPLWLGLHHEVLEVAQKFFSCMVRPLYEQIARPILDALSSVWERLARVYNVVILVPARFYWDMYVSVPLECPAAWEFVLKTQAQQMPNLIRALRVMLIMLGKGLYGQYAPDGYVAGMYITRFVGGETLATANVVACYCGLASYPVDALAVMTSSKHSAVAIGAFINGVQYAIAEAIVSIINLVQAVAHLISSVLIFITDLLSELFRSVLRLFGEAGAASRSNPKIEQLRRNFHNRQSTSTSTLTPSQRLLKEFNEVWNATGAIFRALPRLTVLVQHTHAMCGALAMSVLETERWVIDTVANVTGMPPRIHANVRSAAGLGLDLTLSAIDLTGTLIALLGDGLRGDGPAVGNHTMDMIAALVKTCEHVGNELRRPPWITIPVTALAVNQISNTVVGKISDFVNEMSTPDNIPGFSFDLKGGNLPKQAIPFFFLPDTVEHVCKAAVRAISLPADLIYANAYNRLDTFRADCFFGEMHLVIESLSREIGNVLGSIPSGRKIRACDPPSLCDLTCVPSTIRYLNATCAAPCSHIIAACMATCNESAAVCTQRCTYVDKECEGKCMLTNKTCVIDRVDAVIGALLDLDLGRLFSAATGYSLGGKLFRDDGIRNLIYYPLKSVVTLGEKAEEIIVQLANMTASGKTFGQVMRDVSFHCVWDELANGTDAIVDAVDDIAHEVVFATEYAGYGILYGLTELFNISHLFNITFDGDIEPPIFTIELTEALVGMSNNSNSTGPKSLFAACDKQFRIDGSYDPLTSRDIPGAGFPRINLGALVPPFDSTARTLKSLARVVIETARYGVRFAQTADHTSWDTACRNPLLDFESDMFNRYNASVLPVCGLIPPDDVERLTNALMDAADSIGSFATGMDTFWNDLFFRLPPFCNRYDQDGIMNVSRILTRISRTVGTLLALGVKTFTHPHDISYSLFRGPLVELEIALVALGTGLPELKNIHIPEPWDTTTSIRPSAAIGAIAYGTIETALVFNDLAVSALQVLINGKNLYYDFLREEDIFATPDELIGRVHDAITIVLNGVTELAMPLSAIEPNAVKSFDHFVRIFGGLLNTAISTGIELLVPKRTEWNCQPDPLVPRSGAKKSCGARGSDNKNRIVGKEEYNRMPAWKRAYCKPAADTAAENIAWWTQGRSRFSRGIIRAGSTACAINELVRLWGRAGSTVVMLPTRVVSLLHYAIRKIASQYTPDDVKIEKEIRQRGSDVAETLYGISCRVGGVVASIVDGTSSFSSALAEFVIRNHTISVLGKGVGEARGCFNCAWARLAKSAREFVLSLSFGQSFGVSVSTDGKKVRATCEASSLVGSLFQSVSEMINFATGLFAVAFTRPSGAYEPDLCWSDSSISTKPSLVKLFDALASVSVTTGSLVSRVISIFCPETYTQGATFCRVAERLGKIVGAVLNMAVRIVQSVVLFVFAVLRGLAGNGITSIFCGVPEGFGDAFFPALGALETLMRVCIDVIGLISQPFADVLNAGTDIFHSIFVAKNSPFMDIISAVWGVFTSAMNFLKSFGSNEFLTFVEAIGTLVTTIATRIADMLVTLIDHVIFSDKKIASTTYSPTQCLVHFGACVRTIFKTLMSKIFGFRSLPVSAPYLDGLPASIAAPYSDVAEIVHFIRSRAASPSPCSVTLADYATQLEKLASTEAAGILAVARSRSGGLSVIRLDENLENSSVALDLFRSELLFTILDAAASGISSLSPPPAAPSTSPYSHTDYRRFATPRALDDVLGDTIEQIADAKRLNDSLLADTIADTWRKNIPSVPSLDVLSWVRKYSIITCLADLDSKSPSASPEPQLPHQPHDSSWQVPVLKSIATGVDSVASDTKDAILTPAEILDKYSIFTMSLREFINSIVNYDAAPPLTELGTRIFAHSRFMADDDSPLGALAETLSLASEDQYADFVSDEQTAERWGTRGPKIRQTAPSDPAQKTHPDAPGRQFLSDEDCSAGCLCGHDTTPWYSEIGGLLGYGVQCGTCGGTNPPGCGPDDDSTNCSDPITGVTVTTIDIDSAYGPSQKVAAQCPSWYPTCDTPDAIARFAAICPAFNSRCSGTPIDLFANDSHVNKLWRMACASMCDTAARSEMFGALCVLDDGNELSFTIDFADFMFWRYKAKPYLYRSWLINHLWHVLQRAKTPTYGGDGAFIFRDYIFNTRILSYAQPQTEHKTTKLCDTAAYGTAGHYCTDICMSNETMYAKANAIMTYLRGCYDNYNSCDGGLKDILTHTRDLAWYMPVTHENFKWYIDNSKELVSIIIDFYEVMCENMCRQPRYTSCSSIIQCVEDKYERSSTAMTLLSGWNSSDFKLMCDYAVAHLGKPDMCEVLNDEATVTQATRMSGICKIACHVGPINVPEELRYDETQPTIEMISASMPDQCQVSPRMCTTRNGTHAKLHNEPVDLTSCVCKPPWLGTATNEYDHVDPITGLVKGPYVCHYPIVDYPKIYGKNRYNVLPFICPLTIADPIYTYWRDIMTHIGHAVSEFIGISPKTYCDYLCPDGDTWCLNLFVDDSKINCQLLGDLKLSGAYMSNNQLAKHALCILFDLNITSLSYGSFPIASFSAGASSAGAHTVSSFGMMRDADRCPYPNGAWGNNMLKVVPSEITAGAIDPRTLRIQKRAPCIMLPPEDTYKVEIYGEDRTQKCEELYRRAKWELAVAFGGEATGETNIGCFVRPDAPDSYNPGFQTAILRSRARSLPEVHLADLIPLAVPIADPVQTSRSPVPAQRTFGADPNGPDKLSGMADTEQEYPTVYDAETFVDMLMQQRRDVTGLYRDVQQTRTEILVDMTNAKTAECDQNGICRPITASVDMLRTAISKMDELQTRHATLRTVTKLKPIRPIGGRSGILANIDTLDMYDPSVSDEVVAARISRLVAYHTNRHKKHSPSKSPNSRQPRDDGKFPQDDPLGATCNSICTFGTMNRGYKTYSYDNATYGKKLWILARPRVSDCVPHDSGPRMRECIRHTRPDPLDAAVLREYALANAALDRANYDTVLDASEYEFRNTMARDARRFADMLDGIARPAVDLVTRLKLARHQYENAVERAVIRARIAKKASAEAHVDVQVEWPRESMEEQIVWTADKIMQLYMDVATTIEHTACEMGSAGACARHTRLAAPLTEAGKRDLVQTLRARTDCYMLCQYDWSDLINRGCFYKLFPIEGPVGSTADVLLSLIPDTCQLLGLDMDRDNGRNRSTVFSELTASFSSYRPRIPNITLALPSLGIGLSASGGNVFERYFNQKIAQISAMVARRIFGSAGSGGQAVAAAIEASTRNMTTLLTAQGIQTLAQDILAALNLSDTDSSLVSSESGLVTTNMTTTLARDIIDWLRNDALSFDFNSDRADAQLGILFYATFPVVTDCKKLECGWKISGIPIVDHITLMSPFWAGLPTCLISEAVRLGDALIGSRPLIAPRSMLISDDPRSPSGLGATESIDPLDPMSFAIPYTPECRANPKFFHCAERINMLWPTDLIPYAIARLFGDSALATGPLHATLDFASSIGIDTSATARFANFSVWSVDDKNSADFCFAILVVPWSIIAAYFAPFGIAIASYIISNKLAIVSFLANIGIIFANLFFTIAAVSIGTGHRRRAARIDPDPDPASDHDSGPDGSAPPVRNALEQDASAASSGAVRRTSRHSSRRDKK